MPRTEAARAPWWVVAAALTSLVLSSVALAVALVGRAGVSRTEADADRRAAIQAEAFVMGRDQFDLDAKAGPGGASGPRADALAARARALVAEWDALHARHPEWPYRRLSFAPPAD